MAPLVAKLTGKLLWGAWDRPRAQGEGPTNTAWGPWARVEQGVHCLCSHPVHSLVPATRCPLARAGRREGGSCVTHRHALDLVMDPGAWGSLGLRHSLGYPRLGAMSPEDWPGQTRLSSWDSP